MDSFHHLLLVMAFSRLALVIAGYRVFYQLKKGLLPITGTATLQSRKTWLSCCLGLLFGPLLGQGSSTTFNGVTYDIYVADLANESLQFHFQTSEQQSFQSISGLVTALGGKAKFITNGGIFHPNGMPVGLYVEGGRTRVPLNDQAGVGNFFLQPNGIFYVNKWGKANLLQTDEFIRQQSTILPNVAYALQSGPMLFVGEQIHHAFRPGSTNRLIRSGVGLLDYKQQQFVFVLSRAPVNFYEFARFFQQGLGCSHALYLDGTISKMYNPDIQRLDLDGNFSVLISVLPK